MQRWTAMLSVFGLFVLGILIGALGMQLWHGSRSDGRAFPAREGRAGAHAGMHEMLTRRLDLSPEQRERIGAILEESREEGRRIHEEMLPRVQEHMERTRERIREVLTPEQQERFDRLARGNRRAMERMFLGPGGRRHGPHRGGPAPGPPEPPPGE